MKRELKRLEELVLFLHRFPSIENLRDLVNMYIDPQVSPEIKKIMDDTIGDFILNQAIPLWIQLRELIDRFKLISPIDSYAGEIERYFNDKNRERFSSKTTTNVPEGLETNKD